MCNSLDFTGLKKIEILPFVFCLLHVFCCLKNKTRQFKQLFFHLPFLKKATNQIFEVLQLRTFVKFPLLLIRMARMIRSYWLCIFFVGTRQRCFEATTLLFNCLSDENSQA